MSLITSLRAHLTATATAAHAREDVAACAAGLTVTRTGALGSGRAYRDPRFDARRDAAGLGPVDLTAHAAAAARPARHPMPTTDPRDLLQQRPVPAAPAA